MKTRPQRRGQERWATSLGLDVPDLAGRLEPVWRDGSIGAISLMEVERRITAALGLDEERLRAFMDDVWADYLGTLNENLVAYFGGLRPRYKTGILSNSFVGAREREQAAYGFEDLCDVVVYSHEEGVLKPDARLYRILCERLEVLPHEFLFLDDVQACVDGARAVGMHAIRFVDNQQAIDGLETLLKQSASMHPRA